MAETKPGGADTLSPAPSTITPSATAAEKPVIGAAATGDTSIRPFQFQASDEDLADLKRRIAATRWPERETVADDTQGVQLATMQKLADYWANEHDWRKVEARLNSYPKFITNIDGLDIHFIHISSKHRRRPAARHHPRLAWVDHRAIEDHRAADRPDRPRRQGGGCVRRRHPVDAGLRLFRKAERPPAGTRADRPRLDDADEAPRL